MLNAIPRWVQRMKCPSTTIMNVSKHDGYLHVQPHLQCNKAPPKEMVHDGPWFCSILLSDRGSEQRPIVISPCGR